MTIWSLKRVARGINKEGSAICPLSKRTLTVNLHDLMSLPLPIVSGFFWSSSNFLSNSLGTPVQWNFEIYFKDQTLYKEQRISDQNSDASSAYLSGASGYNGHDPAIRQGWGLSVQEIAIIK